MRHLYLKSLLISCLSIAQLTAQNTFSAEYFFDFDPGRGLGTAITATEGDSVFTFSADKSGLVAGFHIIYIRAFDDAGRLSHHVLKPFFIHPSEVQDTSRADIVYAEYFFDSDPGLGNGDGIALTPAVDTEAMFSINKGNLAPGFHILYIRARDEDNSWTLHIARPFLITAPVEKTLTSVSAIEYYFVKDGVQSDTFRVADFEAGIDVVINFQPDFSTLLLDSTYDFHVFAVDSAGRRSLNFVYGEPVVTDIAEDDLALFLPKTLQLENNYPNPFNPSTTIKFALPRAALVKMVIYDILGRQVALLLNKSMPGGFHSIVWDGKNNSKQRVASGIYIYQLSADQKVLSRKMMLLK